ncbi:hypothetical protein HJG60_009018 [Phyllostomus discolor]|uniref:Uncharacterized protein n=1 Tax=Phyllostomus discolor TaxID=89673 RepID=A0A833YPL9_9CHIR|nr:hypothetical protein HJG60_009018 [Phyllostomus discolor]
MQLRAVNAVDALSDSSQLLPSYILEISWSVTEAKEYPVSRVAVLATFWCDFSLGFYKRLSRGAGGGGWQIGTWNGAQNSACSGNIRMPSPPHQHRCGLGEGTNGAGPLRAVLNSNSLAANLWCGHLTYL